MDQPTPQPPLQEAARVQPRPLSLTTKVLFGIGSMEDGSQLIVVGGVLLLYYSQILHVPASLVSLALGVSLFVDAVFDLLVAQFSDNLRARLGRRHPLMYASILPVGISFIALWTPPHGLSQHQLFLWLCVTVTAFRFSHSLYMVPSGALLPEIAPGYHDRTQMYGFRYMLGATGGAIAAILTYGVFLRKTPEFPLGQLNPAGYPRMAIAVGLLMMAANLISDLGTHSRIPHLYRPAPRDVRWREWAAEVAAIFSNRNFLIAVAGGVLAAIPVALTAGLLIYINTFIFSLPSKSVALLVATQAISAPIGFALAAAVSAKLEKKRAYLALYATGVIVTHGPLVLRLLGLLPPNGAASLLPILISTQTVAGILTISGSIVNTSMIADVVEENQARTARRSEGLVLFSDRLTLKLASGLATILPGILLAIVKFPAGARPSTLDPAIMRHLAEIYLLLAFTLSGLAILTWRTFRIDQAGHQKNLAVIAARRAAAADRPEA
ncbi:MFS transporter [Phenylobacterium sp.]|jgi:Na+/melibiose symporter-like transporter|uniref:MFS transporter n=1 Tax=Phenylobacterium sp. TaxID=1871053 RepID=UPI002F3ECF69